MNRLQLVKRLREKCGAAGTGPASTVNQTGESLRLVNFIDDAWLDIQTSRNDWGWMQDDFTLTTTVGQRAYAMSALGALTDRVVDDTIRIYPALAGRGSERFLDFMTYPEWRAFYDTGLVANGPPTLYTTRQRDNTLILAPAPDAEYVVTGERRLSPKAMETDTDVPGLPEKFHMLIVYRAMIMYGEYEAAAETHHAGTVGYTELRKRLVDDQTPRVTL